jgi:rhodanese-related sulfurtransferase
MSNEVDVRAFAAAHADGALVVDVRERHEYAGGHVPGARLMPMGEVHARLAELRGHRPVYVICASGNRSLLAARWMAAAGIDARSVAGGTAAWIRSGGRVARGLRENAV